jgi:hypothetical protein
MDYIQESVRWIQFTAYDLPQDVPAQPVASENIISFLHRLQCISVYSQYCSLMLNMRS